MAGNFRYSDRDFIKAGAKSKFKANIEALKTLQAIKAEGRDTATPEEQAILSKFVGWGQFPAVFNDYWEDKTPQEEKDRLKEQLSEEDYSARFGHKEWEKERKLMKGLLSEDEWAAAKRSTINAHYTHPSVIDAHWKMAQKLGFKGGRFLETSAGVGYYLGMMPEDLAGRTRSSAVELDTSTGKMLGLLYPKANVKVQGFQDFQAPDGFYDLVASNVPFSAYKPFDPRYNKHKAALHDYFFLKSADLARPGGLIMHITSTGTMDKPGQDIRDELAKTCDLVSAVRFPGSTHKENAGTEVVTDMLILRKRQPGEAPSGPAWAKTTTVPDPAGGDAIPVNEYFAAHPEQILGTLDRTGTMYRGESVNVSRTDDYEARLQQAIDRLPAGVYQAQKAPKDRFEPKVLPAPGDVKDGGYLIDEDGKLFVREGGKITEQTVDAKTLERIKGHLAVRDATREVINRQTAGEDATAARANLNAVYDAYVAKHGYLNEPANKRAFRADPDSFLLQALENWNAGTKTATKADMFSKDTIKHVPRVTTAGSVHEGLGVSLHETGGVDIDHISRLTGKHPDAVGKELVEKGVAFQDPGEGWKPADQYLSGNVRQKLTLARAAAAADPKFAANVAALEKVQPEDLDHHDIDVKLGAHWVPPSDIRTFAASLVNGDQEHFDIGYLPTNGSWTSKYTSKGEQRIAQSLAAKKQWGTERVRFDELLHAGLNNTQVVVRDPDPTDPDGKKTIVNKQATDDAQAKVQEIKDEFKKWIWSDDDRRQRLHRYYNDNFNNIRHIEYDGSHQTFPGMNPAFKPHAHIPNFVWQVVTTGKGLMAHEVGMGKTSGMVMTAMELRRLGLARKPAIACLKANIEQITKEALGIYPGAKILSTADMFDAKKRKATMSKIATGDYDLIIMTHDHLNLLKMRPETRAGFIQEEIGELEEAIAGAQKDNPDKGNRIVKQLEAAKLKLEAKLQAATTEVRKDDTVFFEDCGIDHLLVDECFPGETEVMTDRGPLPIREIVENQLNVQVLSCNHATGGLEYRPVLSWMKNPLRGSLVKVTHEAGSFLCTPNHNIWTEEEGYVPAWLLQSHHTLWSLSPTVPSISQSAQDQEVLQPRVLCRGQSQFSSAQQEVFAMQAAIHDSPASPTLLRTGLCEQRPRNARHEEVPSLQAAVHATGEGRRWAEPFLLEVVRPDMALVGPGEEAEGDCCYASGDHGRGSAGIVGENEGQQSNVRSRRQREDAAIVDRQDLPIKRRQRPTYGAAEGAGRSSVLANRASHTDRASEGAVPFLAKVLQGGYCESGATDRCRSGRSRPQAEEVAVLGQEENRRPFRARVVRVAIHQQAGYGENAARCEGNPFVYNLEVAETHNYFADGVNVSNCHKFKTLPVWTKQARVKGIPTGRSQRATNMLMRTRWLMDNNNGRGVVFATGTPVANTMAELYNMQRYLQPHDLKERGLYAFDAWANQFGDIVTKPEFTVTGEYKPTSRFAEFTNIPELMQMSRQMMDVQRIATTLKPDGSPIVVRPQRKDHMIIAPKSPATDKLMAELAERAKAIKAKKGPPQKGDDNMLVVTMDGKKGSIDMRLIDPNAPDDPQSKLNLAIQNVLKVHKENPGQTQLIFSDIGVHPMKARPKKGAAAEDEDGGEEDAKSEEDVEREQLMASKTNFHLYGDIIEKLVKGGVPREKIADFSQLEGVKKDAAMDAMRRGDILIGIGSTEKLGTGVNVQKKLKAVHHLDVPYVPASIEQRDGRIWRQGNENKQIDVYRAISQPLDQIFWGIVGRKQMFINQVMTGANKSIRSVKDEDTEELTPDQLMAYASGDTRILEKVELEGDVKHLSQAAERHDRDQEGYKKAVQHAEKTVIPQLQQRADNLSKAAKHFDANPDFSLKIGSPEAGVRASHYGERKAAGEALAKKVAEINEERGKLGTYETPEEEHIGEYRGMKIVAPGDEPRQATNRAHLHLVSPEGQRFLTGDSLGSIEAVARTIPKNRDQAHADVAREQQNLEKIRANIGKTFTKGEDLKKKQERLQALEAEFVAESKAKNEPEQPVAPPQPEQFARLFHFRAFDADVRRRYARKDAPGQTTFQWDETKHPRGQPENAGTFDPSDPRMKYARRLDDIAEFHADVARRYARAVPCAA